MDGARRCAMMSGGQLRDSLMLTTPIRKGKERPTFPFSGQTCGMDGLNGLAPTYTTVETLQ